MINSFIFGEIHSLDLPNSRYYLNPYNQKITIIPTDYGEIKSLSFQDSLPNNLGSNRLRIPYLEQIIFSEKFIETYVKNLNLFIDYSEKFESNINYKCKHFNSSCRSEYNPDIIQNNLNIILKKKKQQIYEFQEFLIRKKELINKFKLSNKNVSKLKYEKFLDNYLYSAIYKNGKTVIYNITPFKLKFKKIKFTKKNNFDDCTFIKEFENLFLNPSDFDIPNRLQFNLNEYLAEFNEYEIFSKLKY